MDGAVKAPLAAVLHVSQCINTCLFDERRRRGGDGDSRVGAGAGHFLASSLAQPDVKQVHKAKK
ncbi:hypothetical protein CHR62_03545 [Pusillimonas sp. NJUB218]|nr:hypothetical protein CHR62_03545 [Pusillimonas sp. NJUB218]